MATITWTNGILKTGASNIGLKRRNLWITWKKRPTGKNKVVLMKDMSS